MQPTMAALPLPLRNALAELALRAHVDDAALAALGWLAEPTQAPGDAAGAALAAVHLIDPGGRSLLAVHAPHAATVRAHAARAERAARAARADAGTDGLAGTVTRAAALWDERLFFEVHEVLETAWKHARGAVRQALQGVIQIAVAFHHLAHGNRRGARALLVEGRARLAAVPADTLPGLDAPALLAATAAWEATLAGGGAVGAAPPRFPRAVGPAA